MIILDTNIFFEMMQSSMDQRVERWLSNQDPAELTITTATRAEIRYGIARLPISQRRTAYQRSADTLFGGLADRELTFDIAAADRYGEIVAHRDSIGHPIGVFDAQIAAISWTHGAPVATRNVSDFADTDVTIINPFDS